MLVCTEKSVKNFSFVARGYFLSIFFIFQPTHRVEFFMSALQTHLQINVETKFRPIMALG